MGTGYGQHYFASEDCKIIFLFYVNDYETNEPIDILHDQYSIETSENGVVNLHINYYNSYKAVCPMKSQEMGFS